MGQAGFEKLQLEAKDHVWQVEASHSEKNKDGIQTDIVVAKYSWQKNTEKTKFLFASWDEDAFHLHIVTAKMEFHQSN